MAGRIEILDKRECCGCSACYAACPVECISMEFDEEGFAYPRIDEASCISCGRCLSVCPLHGENSQVGARPVEGAYAVANKDSAIRARSTSGGVFDVLARRVVEQGGVVVGAYLDSDMRVIHGIADTMDCVALFYGSKYVQSDLAAHDVFRRVREKLVSGVPVLFSGTPCQVQALRTFLGRDYDNLTTCDVVCRAVPSPLAWRDYVRLQEQEHGSKMVNAVFRNKTYGYHSGSMKTEFENGDVYYGSAHVDLLHKAFFASMITRPSCHECKFRRTDRWADFTVFDCWGFSSHTGLPDDDRGWTNVMCRGDAAEDLLLGSGDRLDCHEVDLPAVLATDGVMATKDVAPNPNREAFLACLFDEGFDVAVSRYLPISRADRVFESWRGVLAKTGVLSVLKKAKKAAKKAKKKQN